MNGKKKNRWRKNCFKKKSLQINWPLFEKMASVRSLKPVNKSHFMQHKEMKIKTKCETPNDTQKYAPQNKLSSQQQWA